VILGDYSDGTTGGAEKAHSMVDIKGRSVNLVELSVSQYLLHAGSKNRA